MTALSLYPENKQDFIALEASRKMIWQRVPIDEKTVFFDPENAIYYKKRVYEYQDIDGLKRLEETRDNTLKAHALCAKLDIIAPRQISIVLEAEPMNRPKVPADKLNIHMYTVSEAVVGKDMNKAIYGDDFYHMIDFNYKIYQASVCDQSMTKLFLDDIDRYNRNMVCVSEKDHTPQFGHYDLEGAFVRTHNISDYFDLHPDHPVSRQYILQHFQKGKEKLQNIKNELPDYYKDMTSRFKEADTYIKTSPIFSGPPL